MGIIKELPPSQLDLQAFIDNELSPAQHARIVRWLARHPDQRRELLELKLRENLLRAAIMLSKQRS